MSSWLLYLICNTKIGAVCSGINKKSWKKQDFSRSLVFPEGKGRKPVFGTEQANKIGWILKT